LNHLQFRASLLPNARLVDLNSDEILELLRLSLRMQVIQITSLMDAHASSSFATYGPFATHSWTIPLIAIDADGDRVNDAYEATTYSTALGGIFIASLTFEELKNLGIDASGAIKEIADGVIESDAFPEILTEILRDIKFAAEEVESYLTGLSASADAESAAEGLSDLADSAATPERREIYDGLVKVFQAAGEVKKSFNAKTQALEFAASTPLLFDYAYRRMTSTEIVVLHLTELLGAVGLPVVIQFFGGEALDAYLLELTDNPISVFSIESMMGVLVADGFYWAINNAYHLAAGTPSASSIAAYIAGDVSMMFSVSFASPESWIYYRSPGDDRIGAYDLAPTAGTNGNLSTKIRMRAKFNFGATTNHYRADAP
jgi:hypothetical protein